MADEVVLTGRAMASLTSLEPALRSAVEAHLVRLGVSPSSVSRPVVSPPYPPGGMVSEFDGPPGPNGRHHFAIVFRYSGDETQLQVIAIGHTWLADS